MYFSIEVSEGFYGFADPRYHLQMGLSLSPMQIQENVPGRGQLDHLNNELIPSALRYVWLAGEILV